MQLFPLWNRVKNRYRRYIAKAVATRMVQLRPGEAIVSFTFDDFPLTALETGGRILEQYGLVGTYYAALGLAGKTGPVGRYFSESHLPDLLQRGHELGCHTYDHFHGWVTPAAEYEHSVVRNQQRLAQILPGVTFGSHSYPISCPSPWNKRISESRYSAARGGEQKANGTLVDANNLDAFFIEKSRENLAAIRAQIDQAKVTASWLIFATHDICNEPSPFGCTREVFETVVRYTAESGIKVLPVSRAFAYLQGR
jgi:peptidoglycan/xylan/chitin deacetylase (PgdA/CDA1 family)